MVHVEGPGGEELTPRERSRLYDHERLAIERFRCPTCDSSMVLLERMPLQDTGPVDEDADCCELIAACRQCMVSYSREEWRAHLETG